MEESRFTEYLMHFGLSRQEALVYQQLLEGGKQTGYEVAKEVGISRSNAYSSLAALVEKGAAYLVKETAKRYIPVCPEEFCGNHIRRMEEEKAWLTEHLPGEHTEEDGYITIEGERNIRNRIRLLLEQAEERVYLSCSSDCVGQFAGELEMLSRQGKKVVLITDKAVDMEGILVYTTEDKGKQVGLIADSGCVLSGEYGPGSMNTCLYSGRKNFVTLFKNALANEIELIRIKHSEGEKE